MNFGFGEAICPSCYNGEQPFLFLDDSFFLNRIISLHLRQKSIKSKIKETDLEYMIFTQPQMEKLKS